MNAPIHTSTLSTSLCQICHKSNQSDVVFCYWMLSAKEVLSVLCSVHFCSLLSYEGIELLKYKENRDSLISFDDLAHRSHTQRTHSCSMEG